MGTRGLYGFHKGGQDKLTYNHWDSYPSGLGEQVVGFLLETPIEQLNTIFDEIIMVDGKTTPSPEEIEYYRQFADTGVSTGQLTEWYVLLRQTQGDLNFYKNGLKHMIDNRDFIKDSLFCEWAYIINLDTEMLEIYEGFQKKAHENRYTGAGHNRDGYWPCALAKEVPLSNLENWYEGLEEVE